MLTRILLASGNSGRIIDFPSASPPSSMPHWWRLNGMHHSTRQAPDQTSQCQAVSAWSTTALWEDYGLGLVIVVAVCQCLLCVPIASLCVVSCTHGASFTRWTITGDAMLRKQEDGTRDVAIQRLATVSFTKVTLLPIRIHPSSPIFSK